MGLIKAADAAFPPSLDTLTADIRVVLGYCGEANLTPHIWTRAEVDAVRASGREWWAIIVPPETTAMSAQTGHDAATYALKALPTYAHPKSAPIFFDVELSAWEASEQGCRDAVAAFKADMRAAGFLQAYGYTPAGMGIDWVAIWSGHTPSDVPAELPSGCIGQQYLGDYGGWDYSVFDETLYIQDPQPSPVDPTNDDWFDMATKQDLIDVLKTPEVLTAISHKVREDIWNMLNNRSGNGSMHAFWSGGAPMVSAAVTTALKGLPAEPSVDDVAAAVVAALNTAGAAKQVNGLADGVIDRLDDRGYGNSLKGARRGLDPGYQWTKPTPPSPEPGQ